MQCTADIHHKIPHSFPEESDGVLDNATSLDAAHHMLDTYSDAGNLPVESLLFLAEFCSPGFLCRHDDLDSLKVKAKKPQILHEKAPFGERIGGGVCNRFVMDCSCMHVAEEKNPKRFIHKDSVFHLVALFLPTVEETLILRGTLNRSLRSVMAKRGGLARTSNRSAKACTERAGLSPRLPKV